MIYTWDIINSYKELTDKDFPEFWLKCRVCGSKPRIWLFNNGRYAKCKCFGKYEPGVKAECLQSVYNNEGELTESEHSHLYMYWNYFVKTRKILNLPEGRR